MAEALNLLADRIDELLVAERERVADLSHRLRTPLTALRLDAEGHGAADLIEDVDRLEAEVSELIRAARRPLHEEMAVRSDLAEVVEDRAAFWGALADDDGRTWECRIEPRGPHPVRLPERGRGGRRRRAARQRVRPHPGGHALCGVRARPPADRVVLAVEDGGDGHRRRRRRCSTAARAAAARPASASTSPPAPLGRRAVSSASTAATALGGARVVLDLPRAEGRS